MSDEEPSDLKKSNLTLTILKDKYFWIGTILGALLLIFLIIGLFGELPDLKLTTSNASASHREWKLEGALS